MQQQSTSGAGLIKENAEVSFISNTRGLLWDRLKLRDLQGEYLRLAQIFAKEYRQDQIVLLALINSPELVLCICACISAGLPFCIVSPDRAEAFLKRSRDLEFPETLRPAVIVCERKYSRAFEPYCGAIYASDELSVVSSPETPLQPTAIDPDHVAYYQLTSGSSGVPKAVPITHRMVAANLDEIAERCEVSDRDRSVLWLPFCHDMGLAAFLLSVRLGGSVLLTDTASFVRNPMSWLKNASNFRATISAVPSFACRITARLGRLRQQDLDLGSFRTIWVGAEPIFPKAISDFLATFERYGLQPKAVRPAYGMSEAVVGISMTRPSEAPHVVYVEPHSLELGSRVTLVEPSSNATAYVSNGLPLSGVAVDIWGERTSASLGTLRVGRIMIRGESVAAAYAGRSSDLEWGWRDTGDIGFLHAGELFIVGRRKDIIIRGGVNTAAEDIEQVVHLALGEGVRRVAAFSTLNHRAGTELMFVLCETRASAQQVRDVAVKVLAQSHRIAPDFVLTVPPGAIPLTSSGKIQRQALRELYAIEDILHEDASRRE